MKAYLVKVGIWRIVNGTITRPPQAGADQSAWDDKDKIANGSLILRLAHNLHAGVVGATVAATWTSVSNTWARTSVASVYQDFKAAMRVRVGTSNPAKDITKLYTHLKRLRANTVVILDYVQGMMLLNAIPDEWDHVAAYYVQSTAAVANVQFTAIRTAILAEFDRSGGNRPSQTHIADKISAVKRKGKSPQFSNQKGTNQYDPASTQSGPSTHKRSRTKGRGHGRGGHHGDSSHHHSHLASRLEMNTELSGRPLMSRFLDMQAQPAHELNRALGGAAAAVQQRAVQNPSIAQRPGTLVGNPSRALPSQKVASFTPRGITEYVPQLSKSRFSHAQAFTGQQSKPGRATLPEARSLAERLGTSETSENLKALEALREHRKFVEKSTPYKDALAGERPPSPIPSTSRIEEIVPEPVAHMPPTSKRSKGIIYKVGLPSLANQKGKAKEVDPPAVETYDDKEAIDWGTDEELLEQLQISDSIAEANASRYKSIDEGDTGDSVAYDHIAPQVSFLTIGFIGLGASYVDSPVCICSIDNTSLSAQCLDCKKCEKCSAMNRARSLTKRVFDNDTLIEFIGDSGASATFTSQKDDFTEYRELDGSLEARTANKGVPLKIKGSGTIFLKHQVDALGNTVIIRLEPVYYIPGLSMRLLSIGEWLQQGCTL